MESNKITLVVGSPSREIGCVLKPNGTKKHKSKSYPLVYEGDAGFEVECEDSYSEWCFWPPDDLDKDEYQWHASKGK